MTGLISVAEDAEKRAKNVHQQMREISSEIDTMSDAVSKLQGFAGEGIRNITNDGKLDYSTIRKLLPYNIVKSVNGFIPKFFKRILKIPFMFYAFCNICNIYVQIDEELKASGILSLQIEILRYQTFLNH